MRPRFIHLSLHTEYSLIDSLIRIPQLLDKCKKESLCAIGITDRNNLFAAAKFIRASEYAGVKPIVGAEVEVESREPTIGKFRKTFFCQNRLGFENLCELLTDFYRSDLVGGHNYHEESLLKRNLSGLICLSGDLDGDIGKLILAGNLSLAEERLKNWNELFSGQYFAQINRLGRQSEEFYIKSVIGLVGPNIGLVATNKVRFLDKLEYGAHDARVCIQESRLLSDPNRTNRYFESQFLKNENEMVELFADIPSALENSVNIAVKCNLALDQDQKHYLLPSFPLEEENSEEDLLRKKAEYGLLERLNCSKDKQTRASDKHYTNYKKRLESELEVIIEMGFAGYFLVVADFIVWAKKENIPVGPGRGSGAGSLVAYSLGITELDPMKYDLLFERFLNPERISMPDFDIDFCMDRRDEVIDYVSRKHGKERVAQIITFGKMAAKAVIRDVGRVLGFPYPQVDELAKLIPTEPGITLPDILEDSKSELAKRFKVDDDARAIIDLALQLEGITRNAGTHAGGLVIAPSGLTRFTPLYCEKDSDGMVTQFDMGDIESVGLVKFDLLGLKTLTIIDIAIRSINRLRDRDSLSNIAIDEISLDDSETFKQIRNAKTTAVFQLESRGMRELILRLKPDKFEDLIALVALFRPGPLESGMVDDFISVKHGRAAKYPHPLLENTLKPTYGVILYQEQVMEIARSLAGYTLGAADILRRAMGKKKPEEMAKQRTVFLKGAKLRGVSEQKAEIIFGLIEKFAGYGFNKSHSAAYALVAYQTAWLKTKYPGPFMAAVLSADMDNTEKVVNMIRECRLLKIELFQPDVNKSEYRFVPYENDKIRYGLGAIKGLGTNIVDGILREKKARGPFSSMVDLCKRVREPKINRRSLELLVKAGSFDSIDSGRTRLLRKVDYALQIAEQDRQAKEVGQKDLFGLEQPDRDEKKEDTHDRVDPISDPNSQNDEILNWEKDSLGLYLTGHPIDCYTQDLKLLTSSTISELKQGKNQIAGLIVGVRTIRTRKGEIGVITVDDRTGIAELILENTVFNRHIDLLIPEKIAIFNGWCNLDKYTNKMNMQVDSVSSLDLLREQHASQIVLEIEEASINDALIEALAKILREADSGTTQVCLFCVSRQSTARFRFGKEWRVKANSFLIDSLKRLLSQDKIKIEYGDMKLKERH